MSTVAESINSKKDLHVHLLTPDEYDKLPYDHLDVSLGLSDPKTGHAYVRKSGIPALDLLVIGHELEELTSKLSPHEINGIRYKSGGTLGKWLAPVLGAVLAPFTGGTSLAWLPALAGAGLAAGTGYYSQSKKPEKYGDPGSSIFSDALLGGMGGWGGGQFGQGFGAGWGNAGAGGAGLLGKLGGGMQGGLLGTAPGMSLANSGGGLWGGLGNLFSGTKNLFSRGNSLLGGMPGGMSGASSDFLKGVSGMSLLSPSSSAQQPAGYMGGLPPNMSMLNDSSYGNAFTPPMSSEANRGYDLSNFYLGNNEGNFPYGQSNPFFDKDPNKNVTTWM